MSDSAFRSSICKSALAAIEEDAAVRDAVLSATPAAHVQLIRDAGRLGWIEAAVFNALNFALLEAVKDEAFIEFWRRHTWAAVKTPLFGSMFSGALRLFGVEPGGMIRLVGRAWDASTRGMGHVDCALGTREATLRLSGVPRETRLPTLPLAMHGSLLGLLDLTGHKGSVELDASHFATRGEYEARTVWRAEPSK